MYIAAMAVLAVTASSCNLTGPSGSVTGNWIARGPNPRTDNVGLMLQQTGDTIVGTACAFSVPVQLYNSVLVRGDYPQVRFDVAAQPSGASGIRFVGRQDSTQDIVGTYSGYGRTVDLRFTRTDGRPCP